MGWYSTGAGAALEYCEVAISILDEIAISILTRDCNLVESEMAAGAHRGSNAADADEQGKVR